MFKVVMPVVFVTAILFYVSGCHHLGHDHIPPIQENYRDAAKIDTRNPVIVIHGVLGARLTQRSTGRVLWGAFNSDSINPKTPEGTRLISLPLETPRETAYSPDLVDVYADGPLETLDVSLAFPVISVNVYRNIIRTLGAGGYQDPLVVKKNSPIYAEDHFTCYTFFYDWRRDNVSNAMLLAKFIKETRTEIFQAANNKVRVLQEKGDRDSIERAGRISGWLEKGFKFDIVAHSMGGLIARYYLRYGDQDLPEDGRLPELNWAGSGEIDRLILVATPSFGAMQSFDNLLNGRQEAKILPFYHEALLGTMPAIYQLMPRLRHNVVLDQNGMPADVNLYNAKVWKENNWGLLSAESDRYLRAMLPNVSTRGERMKIAYKYVDWCLRRAKQFHESIDVIPSRPRDSGLFLYAGDVEPTLTRVALHLKSGKLAAEFRKGDLYTPGDGTVPRYSAIADERFGGPFEVGLRSPVDWTQLTFLNGDHLGLTSNANFTNNVLFVLLEQLKQN